MAGFGLCAASALLLAALVLPLSQPSRVEGTPLGRDAAMPEISLPQGEISINTADAQELEALPGIGEKLAQAIVEEREANGPFRLPEDLTAVSGIGDAKLAAIRDELNFD